MGDEILIFGFVIAFIVLSTGTYLYVTSNHGADDVAVIDTDPVLPENENTQLPDAQVNQTETVNETAANITELNLSSINFLHWNHMPITYRILNRTGCEGQPIDNLENVFRTIEGASDSKVDFLEVNFSQDITISCIDKTGLLGEINKSQITCKNITLYSDGVQITGEETLASNHYLIETTLAAKNGTDNIYMVCYVDKNSVHLSMDWKYLEEARIVKNGEVIESVEMSLFKADGGWKECSGFPALGAHDALHALGFAHSDKPYFDPYFGWHQKYVINFRDTMFPYSHCVYKTKLDKKYGDCLTYIYSNGAEGKCEDVNFQ